MLLNLSIFPKLASTNKDVELRFCRRQGHLKLSYLLFQSFPIHCEGSWSPQPRVSTTSKSIVSFSTRPDYDVCLNDMNKILSEYAHNEFRSAPPKKTKRSQKIGIASVSKNLGFGLVPENRCFCVRAYGRIDCAGFTRDFFIPSCQSCLLAPANNNDSRHLRHRLPHTHLFIPRSLKVKLTPNRRTGEPRICVCRCTNR